MGIAISIIEQLLVSRAMDKGSQAAGGIKIHFGLCALAVFFTLIGILFAIYAGFIWANSLLPTEIAALYIAGVCFSIALIAALAIYCLQRHKKRRMAEAKDDLVNTVMQTFENFDKGLAQPIGNNPKTAIALATLAGYVAGEKFL